MELGFLERSADASFCWRRATRGTPSWRLTWFAAICEGIDDRAIGGNLFAWRGDLVAKMLIGNQENEQCVRRIRRHIEADLYEPARLMTRKGIGYQLL